MDAGRQDPQDHEDFQGAHLDGNPIGDDDDSHLGDFIEDQGTLAPADAAMYSSLRGVTKEILDTLTPREAKVLRMRFGIEMNTDHTLEEVGKQFDVTRERIRQIEAKALRRFARPEEKAARRNQTKKMSSRQQDSNLAGLRYWQSDAKPARLPVTCTQLRQQRQAGLAQSLPGNPPPLPRPRPVEGRFRAARPARQGPAAASKKRWLFPTRADGVEDAMRNIDAERFAAGTQDGMPLDLAGAASRTPRQAAAQTRAGFHPCSGSGAGAVERTNPVRWRSAGDAPDSIIG